MLVERWSDPVPPVDLPVRSPLRASSRVALVVLLVLVDLVGVGLVALLWTEPTPGWWFSLLFTLVMITGAVVLWIGYLGSVVLGAERERARTSWADAHGRHEQLDGTVSSRTVSTIEDGTVNTFTLAVDTAKGKVRATWERPTSRSPMLLQSQVPGVGARARVWRIRDAEEDAPVVVEVRDPSVEDGAS